MILSTYRFDGDPAALIDSHQRMLELFPPDSLDLHLAVSDDHGLTVFDSCPDLATQQAFVASAEFLGALAQVGLPSPTIQVLGDVHFAHLRQPVTQ